MIRFYRSHSKLRHDQGSREVADLGDPQGCKGRRLSYGLFVSLSIRSTQTKEQTPRLATSPDALNLWDALGGGLEVKEVGLCHLTSSSNMSR